VFDCVFPLCGNFRVFATAILATVVDKTIVRKAISSVATTTEERMSVARVPLRINASRIVRDDKGTKDGELNCDDIYPSAIENEKIRN